MPDGWTRVSEGFSSRLFERQRGRQNSGRFSGGLFFQSQWISTTLGLTLVWATARLIKLSPISSGLFSERVGAFGSL